MIKSLIPLGCPLGGPSPIMASVGRPWPLGLAAAEEGVDAFEIVAEPQIPGRCSVQAGFSDTTGGAAPIKRSTPEVDYPKLLAELIQFRDLSVLLALTALAGTLELTVVLPHFIANPSLDLGALLFGGVPACTLSALLLSRRLPMALSEIDAAIRRPEPTQATIPEPPDRTSVVTLQHCVQQAGMGYEGAFRLLEMSIATEAGRSQEAVNAVFQLIADLSRPELLPLRLRAMQCLIRVARSRRDIISMWEKFLEKHRVIGATVVTRAVDRRDSSGSYFNESVLFRDEDEIIRHYGEVGRQVLQQWSASDIQLLVDLLLDEQINLIELRKRHLADFAPDQQHILTEIIQANLIPQSH